MSDSTINHADRIALVTGATRGIGAAIGSALAQTGCYVVGTATSADGAQRISEALGEQGMGLVLAVNDAESIASLVEALKQGPGLPEIVVNNAGITEDNLLLRMSQSQWDNVLETNLGGLYRVVKPLLRGMMKKRWGRIINISSVVARMGNAGQANYAASKAGVEGFTRSLALEVASRGITVNAVAPGFIDTDMTAALDEAQTTAMLERIPVGRVGAPAEVAATVAFLAGEAAAYVTGETIHVNGGLSMN